MKNANEISSILHNGEIEMVGRLVDASNATFLVKITLNEEIIQAIYKPIAGEKPLWDFPDGNLANRELAAFNISEMLGWNLVPTTILRDGPLGYGMFQYWIDSQEDEEISRRALENSEEMRRFAIFDAITNNTDRKFGHLLIDEYGKMWGCDHGVTFHSEPKLRTVIWQFAGEELNSEEIATLNTLLSKINKNYLTTLITDGEYDALINRITTLIHTQKFPEPSDDWPSIPWPVF